MITQGATFGARNSMWHISLAPVLSIPSTIAFVLASAMAAFGVQAFVRRRSSNKEGTSFILNNKSFFWDRHGDSVPSESPPFGYAVLYSLAWIHRDSDEWTTGLKAIRVRPCQSQSLPLHEALGNKGSRHHVVMYCLDLSNQIVVFMELEEEADLLDYPFMDRGVRRLAGDAIIVTSVESAKVYALDLVMKQHRGIPATEDINNPIQDTIWVWNTGRCGSTLLHRLLLAAGVNSLSEPFWLEQLCRNRDTLGDDQTRQLLRLCLTLDAHFVSRMYCPNATVTSINPKGIGHYLLDLARAEFPEAKHIFLYRNVLPVVESLGSCFYAHASWMTRVFLTFTPRLTLRLPQFRSKHLRAWLANGELTVTGGAGEGPAIALTLNWIDAVCTWLEVTEPWTPEDATTLRMEEFVDPLRREEVVTTLLRRLLGTRHSFTNQQLEKCLAVFEKHSQAGSKMESSSSKTGERFLSPRSVQKIRELMAVVPDLRVASCRLPNDLIDPTFP